MTTATHAIKPVKRKGLVGAIAILSLLLATCTRPSYALTGDCNNYYSNVMSNINYNHHKYNEFVIFKTSNDCHYIKQRFTSIDLVAVHSNNASQEPRNLLKTVQHRTIADVFFCLSFIGLPFVGKLRLAVVRLWWGGRGNKPLRANTACRLFLAVSSLPTALFLGQIIKNLLPLEQV